MTEKSFSSHEALQPLLNSLQLFSPGLPIGAFAFSQGLEAAIENKLVADSFSLQRWCSCCLEYSLASLDFPAARAAYQAENEQQWRSLTAQLLASRESRELLQEDLLLGQALARWAQEQGMNLPTLEEYSLITLYSWLARQLHISEDALVLGIGWSWLDNQMVVAAKAIPLGQQSLQQLLLLLKPELLAAVAASRQHIEHWYNSMLWQGLLSAQHETQYSRLFRS